MFKFPPKWLPWFLAIIGLLLLSDEVSLFTVVFELASVAWCIYMLYKKITKKSYVRRIIEANDEQILYRKFFAAKYTKLTLLSGRFIVTNKKILFIPYPLYIFHTRLAIDMDGIIKAEPTKILGIKGYLRIFTMSGKEYVFTLSTLNVQPAVAIINQALPVRSINTKDKQIAGEY